MGQDIPTLPEHRSSLLVFSGVHVVQFFVFCVMFCRFVIFFFLRNHVSDGIVAL